MSKEVPNLRTLRAQGTEWVKKVTFPKRCETNVLFISKPSSKHSLLVIPECFLFLFGTVQEIESCYLSFSTIRLSPLGHFVREREERGREGEPPKT